MASVKRRHFSSFASYSEPKVQIQWRNEVTPEIKLDFPNCLNKNIPVSLYETETRTQTPSALSGRVFFKGSS
ncbi:hypothetical protein E2C01_071514 [Portunus trituberculatus]|uniref:Uncharacterized protein n=1 Tax=Portunus trituberculatus TaxID=210409 RepID=A0A5B7HX71_PORTR|nr:hypothetical protein [Portunus trituberculatus]